MLVLAKNQSYICAIVMVQFCLVLTSNTNCPTWFYYNNYTQQCECGYSTGLIKCDQETGTVAIWDSYCATYSGHEGQFYGGVCRMKHRENKTNRMVAHLPTDPDLLNEMMCGTYNRKGLLCGSCKEGYGPAVYSLSLNCVECSKFSIISAIGLYLLVVLLPVTFFYISVILLQLRITSSPLLPYVLFCQGISVSMEYSHIIYDSMIYNTTLYLRLLFQGLVVLQESSNLQFLKAVIPPFCISEEITGIHVLVINSVTATYPFFLVLITCSVIELHARNYTVIHILWKPLSIVFRKIQTKYNAAVAVTNALATFIFLTSTTSMYAFWSMTETVTITSSIDGRPYKESLYFDPTTDFKSTKHLLFLMVTLLQNIVLVGVPSLLLIVYPTRIYKKISQRISGRKQLVITAFAEAFNCSFKDGLNGTPDYRAYAGIVLLFPPLFGFFSAIVHNTIATGYNYDLCAALTCSLVSLQLAYTRPCKRKISNAFFSFYMLSSAIIALIHYLWKNDLIIATEKLEILLAFSLLISHIPAFTWMAYATGRWIYNRFNSSKEMHTL